MARYPVALSVRRPERFDRIQVLVRIVLFAALSLLGVSLGLLFGLVYLLLPAMAAIAISRKGSDAYHEDGGPEVTRALAWLTAAYAYLMLLTDELPAGRVERTVRLEIHPTGASSSGAALARLITSIPMALLLFLLAFVGWIVWVVAALMILLTERYPRPLWDFQCGVLRFQARLLGYHAALVDAYPPFAFDPGPTEGASGHEPMTL